MHIIVEGIDKSGKSTLCLELAKRLYLPVINRMIPKDKPFTEFIEFFRDSSESRIVDRLYISELTYGPVKRKKADLDFRETCLVELTMLTLNTFNIYCTGELKDIKKRCKEQNETFITGNEIDKVYNNFEKEISNSILTWHKYTIGDDIDELAEKIKKHLEKNHSIIRYKIFKKSRTTGNLKGKYLFLGEKYGDRLQPPLIPFGNNQPGLLFFNALKLSGADLDDLMLSNAIKSNREEGQLDDIDLLKKELSFKNLKKVICLGKASLNFTSDVLNKFPEIKVDITSIPHPSFVYQYSSMTTEDYAKIIKKAMILK